MKNERTLVLAAIGALALCACANGQNSVDPDDGEATAVAPHSGSTTTQGARIATDVYERLPNSVDGRVYVRISFKVDYPEISTAEQRAERQVQKQEEVLALFEGDEFEFGYLADRVVIYGHVTAEGLNKLANCPEVRDVSMSKVEPTVHEDINTSGTSRAFVSLSPVPDNLDLVDRERYIRQIHGQEQLGTVTN